MKASIKRFLSILLAILMFVASLFVYSTLIRPAYSEIKSLRAEIAGRLELISKNEVSIQQVKKLLTEYQDIAKVQETISLILPLEQNTSQGVNQIDGLSKLNKLTIDFLSIQQLAIKPSTQPGLVKGLGVLRYNFRLTGTYESLKSFIQAVETNISLMDLVSLKIEPATKSAKDNFSYTVNMDTYYQAE